MPRAGHLLVLLVLPVLLVAGCATPGSGDGPARDDAAARPIEAPWWNIGESWRIEFEQAGRPARTTTLVNFANNTFGDPDHFWLGVADRREALDHVFFDSNPFLGRIHWVLLAPHEKGMHSSMYSWPLEDGDSWGSPILLGKEDLRVEATRRPDGTFAIEGEARADGSRFAYDYDPGTRWFRTLTITEDDGTVALRAEVLDHDESGARGTFYFLRGRDYLDAEGGTTGQERPFTVKEEGATSIAFHLDGTASAGSVIQFIAPDGSTFHEERFLAGGSIDKVYEAPRKPPAGDWKLRYVGSVTGEILVRGVIEYRATI